MDIRIRRGLGLLVVAVIALLLAAWLSNMAGDYIGVWRAIVGSVLALAFLGGLLGGLGLLAYGLLRKPRPRD